MGKCTYVDGIGSSQAIDTAGEIVDIKGLDISSLIGAALNWEHESKLPSQIVGKILEAKKIYSEKDCENSRQSYYWAKCQLPFLYVMGRLFDDQKDSSREVAGLFRDDANHPTEQDMVGFSVEGAKVEKIGAVITRSIARKVTITCIPANKTCIAELLPRKEGKESKDDLASLFKGELELFKFEPSYLEILEKKENLQKDVGSGGGAFIGSSLAMKEKPMKKALEAGSGMSAPGSMVGGVVLGVENLEGKKGKKSKNKLEEDTTIEKNEKKGPSKWYSKADEAYGSWDKKNKFKDYMKKRLPHLAEGEIDAIGRVLALKKTMQAEENMSKMYASHFYKKDKMNKTTDIMMASEKDKKKE